MSNTLPDGSISADFTFRGKPHKIHAAPYTSLQGAGIELNATAPKYIPGDGSDMLCFRIDNNSGPGLSWQPLCVFKPYEKATIMARDQETDEPTLYQFKGPASQFALGAKALHAAGVDIPSPYLPGPIGT